MCVKGSSFNEDRSKCTWVVFPYFSSRSDVIIIWRWLGSLGNNGGKGDFWMEISGCWSRGEHEKLASFLWARVRHRRESVWRWGADPRLVARGSFAYPTLCEEEHRCGGQRRKRSASALLPSCSALELCESWPGAWNASEAGWRLLWLWVLSEIGEVFRPYWLVTAVNFLWYWEIFNFENLLIKNPNQTWTFEVSRTFRNSTQDKETIQIFRDRLAIRLMNLFMFHWIYVYLFYLSKSFVVFTWQGHCLLSLIFFF